MAHAVLPQDYVDKIDKKKERVRIIEKIINRTKVSLPPLVDSLTTLTIVFWYFFFTGLAILFRANIPKQWLDLSKTLTKGKIAKKVNDLSKEEEVKKPVTVRVVDLDTNKPIYLDKDGNERVRTIH